MKKRRFFLFTILPLMLIFIDIYGQILKRLADLGIADNLIVVFTTDSGAIAYWFLYSGIITFMGEKATTWE